jgi:hypothetical protein
MKAEHIIELIKAVLMFASIALPLLYGIYSIKKQARNSFELKTAELLLNSKTPGQLHAKAKVLMKIFRNAPLPSDFPEVVSAFNPNEISGPSLEWKIELFKMLAEHGERKEDMVQLWKQFFPGDKWIERLNSSDSVGSVGKDSGSSERKM